MNHKDAKETEKKKKRTVSRWRYLRLLTLPVAVFLIVSVSLIVVKFASNLQQYNHNRRLWDEGNHSEVLFLYMDGDGAGQNFAWHLMGHHASAEGLWSIASNCIYQVFCEISYNDQYHYPEYIEPFLGEWRAKVDRFITCAEDEDTRRYCDAFLPSDQ
jgi:hypothetical protein